LPVGLEQMSTSLTKPMLGDHEESANAQLPVQSETLGREAFQALLGF